MARIVMDALSHQAIRENGTEAEHYRQTEPGRWRGERLSGFRLAIEARGHSLEILPVTHEALDGADVLMIASRSQVHGFDRDELAAIDRFVRQGGGLFLMANHRHFVAPQEQLARSLDLPVHFNDVTIGGYPDTRLRAHPVTAGCERLHIRNSCSIQAAHPGDVIAHFALDGAHAFAVASERTPDRPGRVVSTADSGFIASRDDAQHQMFEAASNAKFVENAIVWLLERE